MEEFIFGTLATDSLKLMHHRAARHGIQHQHETSPLDPKPGEPVTVTARVGLNLPVDQVCCYFTTDGTQPMGSKGVASTGLALPMNRVGVEWDTLSWGYQTVWSINLPGQPAGVIVRYQIGAWAEDGAEYFADWPHVKAASEAAAAAFFAGQPVPELTIGNPHQPFTFTYSVDSLTAPAWARDAVIYHIFVDRFYPGDGRDWSQTADLNGFCGGTLWGVTQKLDYIEVLGATAIWLSPVFVSPTHHGYDVVDYFHVEPRIGGDEALHELVHAAHQRGIRVILDVAFNHLSDRHPYFQDAQSNPASPYRSWFTFDDSPVGYRSFFGVASMPQLNVTDPACRAWLIDVALYWLRTFNIDGFRLDVADGPGPSFWTDFWTACKAAKPDCFCFGEVVDAPDVQRQYVGKLDGLLDFHLCDALRRTYAREIWSEADLDRFYVRHASYFPSEFQMLSFVDNHDMDRFLLVSGGDSTALRRAAERQFALDRIPVIYYGTEISLSQQGSMRDGFGMHINRVPMRWGDGQDASLLNFYRGLIRRRRGG